MRSSLGAAHVLYTVFTQNTFIAFLMITPRMSCHTGLMLSVSVATVKWQYISRSPASDWKRLLMKFAHGSHSRAPARTDFRGCPFSDHKTHRCSQ